MYIGNFLGTKFLDNNTVGCIQQQNNSDVTEWYIMIENQALEITKLPVQGTPLDLEIFHMLTIIMDLSRTF